MAQFNEAEFIKALDTRDLTTIFRSLEPIIDGAATRLFKSTSNIEDLKSQAIVELLESGALESFDRTKGTAFAYFNQVIRRALCRAWAREKNRSGSAVLKDSEPVSFKAIMVHVGASGVVIGMAEAVDRHRAAGGGLRMRDVGAMLGREGYTRHQRGELWDTFKRNRDKIREIVGE